MFVPLSEFERTYRGRRKFILNSECSEKYIIGFQVEQAIQKFRIVPFIYYKLVTDDILYKLVIFSISHYFLRRYKNWKKSTSISTKNVLVTFDLYFNNNQGRP